MDAVNNRTVRLSKRTRGGLLHSAGVGFLFSLLFGAVLLFLGTFLLLQAQDPIKYAPLVGFLLLAATALLGGFTAGRRNKQQGALAGLLTGVFWLVLLFLLSLFLEKEGSSLLFACISRGLLLLFAMLGGIWGEPRQKRKKFRR